MKKVCFVLTDYFEYSKGGSEYQAYILANQLKKLGYQISYIFASDNIEYPSHQAGISMLPIKKRALLIKFGPYYSLDAKKVIKILKQVSPDIIYSRASFSYAGIAAFYAKKSNKKMVLHIACDEMLKIRPKLNKPSLFSYLERKLYHYGLKNATVIIGQTEYQNSLLKRMHGRGCDIVVPNFYPRPKCSIRKSEKKLNILWISNFKQIKQPEIFVNLAKIIKNPQVRFYMIGNHNGNRAYKLLLDKILLAGNLKCLGELPIEKVDKILARSHILVNTSLFEGYPNTFVQAWMAKVPVVSLNADPDNIIKKENIGLHSNSFEQLVADIKNLISDKELREKMGERAQNFALLNNELKTNIDRIISVFEQN